MIEHSFVRNVVINEVYEFDYSICTLVNNREEYYEMVSSFTNSGFTEISCEYLYIDNTEGNINDGYQGVNIFLKQAKGQYIIICHQDILVDKDNYKDLEIKLKNLQTLDSKWAICGNAGAAGPNYTVYHISYPNNIFKHKGKFPQKVSSLDENFLIIKNSAMLAASSDLSGFHLYGTDLCLNAEIRGFTSYALDFNVTHKSYGNADTSFKLARRRFKQKYNYLFRTRWIQTNSTVFLLSGSSCRGILNNPIYLFAMRMINGLKKRFL